MGLPLGFRSKLQNPLRLCSNQRLRFVPTRTPRTWCVSGQYGKSETAVGCAPPLYPERVLGSGSILELPATLSGRAYSLDAEAVEDAELQFDLREDFLRS